MYSKNDMSAIPAGGRPISRRSFIAAAVGMGITFMLGGCASGVVPSGGTGRESASADAATAARAALKWWQDTVVYEVYPKSFLDTKGAGTGTIDGIAQKIDYLTELGVGAIWLTPVCRSPMKDNGYDVSDYYDIDPSFGTMPIWSAS